MPTPRRRRLPRGADAADRRPAPRADPAAQPLRAALGRSADRRRSTARPSAASAASASASSASLRRLGAPTVEATLFLVIHLMIAGRLRWREPGKKPGIGPKLLLASFEFAHGTLFFTEAELEEARVDAGGARRGGARARSIPAASSRSRRRSRQFRDALTRENHTLKRALTDPHLSAASATPTRTRSCTRRGCRRSS